MRTSAEYYEDEKNWGDYQYISLEEIVNNFMMSQVSGSHTSLIPRHQVLYQAQRAIRELYYDVIRDVRAVEIELSPRLTMTVPPDFVSLVRVSYVDDSGQLHPIAIDKNTSMAQVYLQDHEYELLFDAEGNVLRDDELPKDNLLHAVRTERFEALEDDEFEELYDKDGDELTSDRVISENILQTSLGSDVKKLYICPSSFQPNKDNSKVYSNGRYNFNKSTGVMQFSSDVFGKSVVLEYISDGLFIGEDRTEADIRIHKFAESTVNDYIYYELVKNMINVPMNEKMRARKDYFNNRRITKRRMNALSYVDLKQVFKGASKWIKQ